MRSNWYIDEITEPEALRLYIRDDFFVKDSLIELFYRIAYRYRVDMIQAFFSETRFTLRDLEFTIHRSDTTYHHFIDSVIEEGYVDVMIFLLDFGLDVNYKFKMYRNESLLMRACFHNKVDIVTLLLARDVDVNSEDDDGNTAILNAMLSPDEAILDHLFVHGVVLHHKNKRGNGLWTSIPWYRYTIEMQPKFQRLADYGVPLDEETYERTLSASETKPRMEGLVVIMQEVMRRQGLPI